MITEDEAFWAGIAVAVMMLGGGFSLLFLQPLTGYGAVVLALGLMTMALTMQMRARPIEQIEDFDDFRKRVFTPTPPIQSPIETLETQPSPQPSQSEAKTESAEHQENVEPGKVEPTAIIVQPKTEPEPMQPSQPQAPVEQKPESPKPEEKPKEEPQVVAPAAN